MNNEQEKLIQAIQQEKQTVLHLKRKYRLTQPIVNYVLLLNKQKKLIEEKRYAISRQALGDTNELWIAYFEDGTQFASRQIKEQEKQIRA